MHTQATGHSTNTSTALVPAPAPAPAPALAPAPVAQANVGIAPAIKMTRFAGGYAGVCTPVGGADVSPGVGSAGAIAPPSASVPAPMPSFQPPDYDFGGMHTVWSSDSEPDNSFLALLGKD